MALASPNVRALCVEAGEFPQLSNHFRVRAVPQTVINRRASFLGALPEPDFVAAALEGAGVLPQEEVPSHADGPSSELDAGP